LLTIIFLIGSTEGEIMPEQKRSSTSYLILVILILTSGTGIISIFLLNTNYGTVDVSSIRIPNQGGYLTGLLYKPKDVSGEFPLPTVICAHGFSNSKQAMSGLALELGRRGFIALALDLDGHGSSDPASNDSTRGIMSAIEYLGSLPYVDINAIGVAGHSMGAWATWETALSYGNITASVLIGGLPDLSTGGPYDGKFNATFPKNVLVAVGEYDEFFDDMVSLNTELMGLFGTTSPVVPNHKFYGSFLPERQDARRLVISNTIHILEPIDPLIITETIQWMQNTLKKDGYHDDYYVPDANHIYQYRDVASIITLLSIVCLFLSLIPHIYTLSMFKQEKETSILLFMKPNPKKIGLVWGCLAILLYFPAMLLGTFIPIPPMIYASSITLWFLLINIITFVLVYRFSSKFGTDFSFKKLFQKDSQIWSAKKGVGLACGLIGGIYLTVFHLEVVFNILLGFIITLFSNLLVLPRFISFIILLPLFLVYFIIDGLLFHANSEVQETRKNLTDEFIDLIRLVSVKLWPFLVVVISIYVPRIIFGFNVLPGGLIALSIQFYWVMGIFFILGSMISWFWYRQTNSILPGAVFNGFIFVWILSSLLPV
jgi:pimeloyl-ACP methyl ester carboxylesterase